MRKTEANHATAWDFALAVISEWRRTIAAVIVIMLLGWPTVVIVQWTERAGLWGSESRRSFSQRANEHKVQTEFLMKADMDRAQMKKSFALLAESIMSHNEVALQRDGVILFFARDLCYTKYGEEANICETLNIPIAGHKGH